MNMIFIFHINKLNESFVIFKVVYNT